MTLVGLGFVAVLIGVTSWTLGLIGISQYAEDICFDDLDAASGYRSYRMETSSWPPRFDCRLAGPELAPVVVHHPFLAVVRFAIVAVYPVVFTVTVLTLGAMLARRRTPEQVNR